MFLTLKSHFKVLKVFKFGCVDGWMDGCVGVKAVFKDCLQQSITKNRKFSKFEYL